MANVGIIYSDVSAHLRRLIVPDDDSVLNDPSLVLPGETMLVVSKDEVAAAQSINDLVLQRKGVILTDPRCAAIDAGTLKVTSVINADPLIDIIPGILLVLTPDAGIGDTYNPLTKTFTKAISL